MSTFLTRAGVRKGAMVVLTAGGADRAPGLR